MKQGLMEKRHSFVNFTYGFMNINFVQNLLSWY